MGRRVWAPSPLDAGAPAEAGQFLFERTNPLLQLSACRRLFGSQGFRPGPPRFGGHAGRLRILAGTFELIRPQQRLLRDLVDQPQALPLGLEDQARRPAFERPVPGDWNRLKATP